MLNICASTKKSKRQIKIKLTNTEHYFTTQVAKGFEGMQVHFIKVLGVLIEGALKTAFESICSHI